MRIVDLFTENCKWELGEDSLPPTLKLRDARRLLHNAGFVSDRSKGSHEYWKHPISGLKFSLPAHHTTSAGITQQLYKLLDMKRHT